MTVESEIVAVMYAAGGYDAAVDGGNVAWTATAERADDASPWEIVTRDGAGAETARRPATAVEAAGFEPPAAPTTPPVDWAALAASLTDEQRAAIIAALSPAA